MLERKQMGLEMLKFGRAQVVNVEELYNMFILNVERFENEKKLYLYERIFYLTHLSRNGPPSRSSFFKIILVA